MVALAKIGPDARPALPSLRKRLTHDDPSVAKLAEEAIEKITRPVAAKPPAEVETPVEPKKPAEKQTEREETEKTQSGKNTPKRRIEVEDDQPVDAGFDKIVAALGDAKAEARDSAIDTLTKMGEKALPALEKGIASTDVDVRKNALACLCKMGKVGRTAAPSCIAALKDSSAEVRRNAAYALGRIGVNSREAVTALTAALKDKDREVRLLAAFALEKVQGGK
jgi:HEAT repeat protein